MYALKHVFGMCCGVLGEVQEMSSVQHSLLLETATHIHVIQGLYLRDRVEKKITA